MISALLPFLLCFNARTKHTGFKVELVLEAPAIEAPTALAVAPNGDVYFAEDPMDMRGPPTKNIDRSGCCKGGDPKKKILFADKMWAVMGLEVVARQALRRSSALRQRLHARRRGQGEGPRGPLHRPRAAGRRAAGLQRPRSERHPHGHGRLALRLDRRQGHPRR